MNLILETGRRLLHSVVHLLMTDNARFCIKEQTISQPHRL